MCEGRELHGSRGTVVVVGVGTAVVVVVAGGRWLGARGRSKEWETCARW